MPTIIRRATSADARALAEFRFALGIEERAGKPLPDDFVAICERWFAKLLYEGGFVAWLAVDGTTPVGTAGYLVRELVPRSDGKPAREARIHNVFVADSSRDRSVGGALMRTLLDGLDRSQWGKISLGARAPARRFYERLGFTAVASEMLLPL